MIRGKVFWGCFAGILGAYLCGLPATLMENDSAQFAVMAMRMVQENDYINLIKGTEQYLDKPHMHYWLAAISFEVFGIQDWAYRIPAILLTLLAALSCFGLGKLLYNANAGRLAALIFMSSQTIVLSVIDVRTDAVLTGFAALAIWQLMRYLQNGSLSGLLWGALGAGLAFSTKGQIALLVIGLPLVCYLFSSRGWHRLADARLVLALLVFALAISPMLYAYYQQFDMHPEKVIRGRDGRSGILFIFWEQSFERLSGSGMGKNSSDYFFFFHTFLWVFLPWTLLGLAAFGNRAGQAVRHLRAKAAPRPEFVTLGGITLIFLIISFAQFKLPHYLNIIIPLFAVLTAGYLDSLERGGNRKWLRRAARVQAGILVLVFLAVLSILIWVFPVPAALLAAVLVPALVLSFYLWRHADGPLVRLCLVSVFASVLVNAVLNLHFYPSLLKYQAGSELAREVMAETGSAPQIHKFTDEHTWALDFYTRKPLARTDMDKVRSLSGQWIYVNDRQRSALASEGVRWDRELRADQFRITRLQARFLNPETRENVLDKRYLLQLEPANP